MDFFLGIPEPSWLPQIDEPCFVSAARLAARCRRRFPKASGPVGIDSGGFSRLLTQGEWTGDDRQHAELVERVADECGNVQIAAPRDWMCEPQMLARTGRTIAYHQAKTIESVVSLRAIAPHLPWIPVLQGWRVDDYLSHVEQYADAGIDLTCELLVGLGTVCRRQSTREGAAIVNALADRGLRMHGFGIKIEGLRAYGYRLASADSMAWSQAARRRKIRLSGHTHSNCNTCLEWARIWARDISSPPPVQRDLWR